MVSLLEAFGEWLNPKPKRNYVDLREKREQDAMKIHLLAKFGKMFGLALLLAAPASAAPIGAQFRDFSGGLNDSTDATAIPPNQSPDLLNLVVDDPVGSARPRGGFVRCGSLPSGNTVTEMYNYSLSDGRQFIVASDNQNVYQTNNCTSFTRILAGQNASYKPNFATVRDKLWIVNGSTFAYVWDGATTTILDGRTDTPLPAPPRGAFIEFWKERVWIARTSGDPSIVQWSALTDSAGNDLSPSTGTTAWPATNALYIDRDGGSPIYGIKAFRDAIYVFKGNGIWRINYNSDFDVSVQKTLSSVGCRFTSSVVELDNFLYFVGPDGIYAFDGDNSKRLSDNIFNRFSEIAQPLVNAKFKIWTSASDFAAGTLDRTSTGTSVGSVVPELTTWDSFTDGNFTAGPTWSVDAGTGSFTVSSGELIYANTTTGGISSTGTANGGMWSIRMRLGRVTGDYARYHFMSNAGRTLDNTCGYTLMVCTNVSGLCVGGGGYPNGVSLTRQASGGTIILGSKEEAPDTDYHDYRIVKDGSNFTVYKDNSEIFTAADGNCTSSVASGWEASGGGSSPQHKVEEIRMGVSSYSMITSDIYDAVTVSSWTSFEADYNANGGAISFEIRWGNTSGNLQASTWTAIIPGGFIGAHPSQTNVQWRAIITASTSAVSFPTINDVTVNWTQGGSQSQTIYGGRWKNRYYISATTGTSTTNNMVLVNSKYDKTSWVPYDLMVGPMIVFDDKFYGAASTHSAINRLDYGTNDAGAAINWYWTSRDEAFGQPLHRKRLMEISTDFRRTSGASSVSVGYSRDQGATFTNSSFSMAGTGRDTDVRYVNGQNSFDYRLRFGSTSLDVAPTIIGITGWANIQPGRH